jgi:uncharacterized protein (TIGR00730 family)
MPAQPTQTICVFCASSTQVKQSYFEATDQLAHHLAKAGYAVVYGGGANGLMGQLADSTLKYGGTITGIIPRFMCELEWNHTALTNLILVETMHERKQKMAMMADAVVAMPGGCGTFEELLEVITWKQLGIFTKPIVIANIDGYFDALINQLNKAVDDGFMCTKHREMWAVVATSDDVLTAIEQSTKWDDNARSFAAL